MARFYDRDGDEISSIRWGRLLRDSSYCAVALSEFDGHRVESVWVGICYPDLGDRGLFLTQMFGDLDVEFDPARPSAYGCRRRLRIAWSATEDEALATHGRMLAAADAKGK